MPDHASPAWTAAQEAFLADWQQYAQASPLDSKTDYVSLKDDSGQEGVVLVDLYPFGQGIHLSSIMTSPEAARRCGMATYVLKHLCMLADRHGVSMDLTPVKFGIGKGLGKNGLKKWYKKHGFAMRRDGSDSMERLPEKAASARLRGFAVRNPQEEKTPDTEVIYRNFVNYLEEARNESEKSEYEEVVRGLEGRGRDTFQEVIDRRNYASSKSDPIEGACNQPEYNDLAEKYAARSAAVLEDEAEDGEADPADLPDVGENIVELLEDHDYWTIGGDYREDNAWHTEYENEVSVSIDWRDSEVAEAAEHLSDEQWDAACDEAFVQVDRERRKHYSQVFTSFEVFANPNWDAIDKSLDGTYPEIKPGSRPAKRAATDYGRDKDNVVYEFADGWYIADVPYTDLQFEAGGPRGGKHFRGICIGDAGQGYIKSVKGGHSKVFSLRSPSGKPMVTVSANVQNGRIMSIDQAKGPGNCPLGYNRGVSSGPVTRYGEIEKVLGFLRYLVSSGQMKEWDDDSSVVGLPRFDREAIRDLRAAFQWEQGKNNFPHQSQSLQMQANPKNAKSRHHCLWCKQPAKSATLRNRKRT